MQRGKRDEKDNYYYSHSSCSRFERRVQDYEEVLAGFVITAPSDGMVIYKKDRLGNKRKAGANINPMDRVVATLPDLSSMLSKVYVSEIDISKGKG